MPLDRLIDLLAEAAVRRLSQGREKQEATPDAIGWVYRHLFILAHSFSNRRKDFPYFA
ncbi:hypothetical protein JDO7802_00095 [Jannaschia donghaensis]|uniref:Uncharacterized protein n=1 Tax=Jannaschia donghaensis TaxID=420998 RepID=A0A0M6YEY7_9RHOB|nr:hypothetical protein JDO7802_00095 [Jannaschia donghaensis]